MYSTAQIKYTHNAVIWILLQLFKKPHPPKRVRSKSNGEIPGMVASVNSTADKIFFHHLDNLRPSLAPVKGTAENRNQ